MEEEKPAELVDTTVSDTIYILWGFFVLLGTTILGIAFLFNEANSLFNRDLATKLSIGSFVISGIFPIISLIQSSYSKRKQ